MPPALEMGLARLTRLAEQAVLVAEELAQDWGSDVVTPAHVLLAVLSGPPSPTDILLARQGITSASAREATTAALGPLRPPIEGHVPFSDDARTALDWARQSADGLGHPWIGVGHLFLGVLAGDAAGRLAPPGLDRTQLWADAGVMEPADESEALRATRLGFTDATRRAVGRAQLVAQQWGAPQIEDLHLLLAARLGAPLPQVADAPSRLEEGGGLPSVLLPATAAPTAPPRPANPYAAPTAEARPVRREGFARRPRG